MGSAQPISLPGHGITAGMRPVFSSAPKGFHQQDRLGKLTTNNVIFDLRHPPPGPDPSRVAAIIRLERENSLLANSPFLPAIG
jgi:hypothetical protein